MALDLEKLTLQELMQQCEHAGISNPQSLMNKKGDERDVLIRECLDRACGGTIDMGGQQHQKLLRHRTLDRKATMITGRARHASHPAFPGVLRRMPRYWKDFVSVSLCLLLRRHIMCSVCVLAYIAKTKDMMHTCCMSRGICSSSDNFQQRHDSVIIS